MKYELCLDHLGNLVSGEVDGLKVLCDRWDHPQQGIPAIMAKLAILETKIDNINKKIDSMIA